MPPTKTRRGPGAKPAAMKRTEWQPLRLSPLEKAALKANAEAAGLDASEFIRQRCCGVLGAPRKPRAEDGHVAPEDRSADFEARIKRAMQVNGVGRHNAETLVRREMAREGSNA